jgi:acetyl-CoA carboxylase carboxyl transferase subunit beta
LHRAKKGIQVRRSPVKRELPEGMWSKCPGCSDIIYRVELEKSLWVCSHCGYHFSISARQYVDLLMDADTFTEKFRSITSLDPLDFKDAKEKYRLKIKKTMLRTNLSEAVLTGTADLHGRPVVLCVFDFAFLGGSMGSAVGEKIARAGLLALDERVPLVIVSRSGGARMHESILSLMQMAKTAGVLAKLHEARLPFVSIMANPTTGGVSASFASLGDVIIAEPQAQIGFAGPRVIRETINQELPEGFQTAEFVLECGFVDIIASRKDMRSVLNRVLTFLCATGTERAAAAEAEATDTAPVGTPLPEPEPESEPDTEFPAQPIVSSEEAPHARVPRGAGMHGPA